MARALATPNWPRGSGGDGSRRGLYYRWKPGNAGGRKGALVVGALVREWTGQGDGMRLTTRAAVNVELLRRGEPMD